MCDHKIFKVIAKVSPVPETDSSMNTPYRVAVQVFCMECKQLMAFPTMNGPAKTVILPMLPTEPAEFYVEPKPITVR